jgi:MFS family permease
VATPRLTIWAGPVRATTSGMLIIVTLIAFEAMAVSAALPTAARELHGIAAYGWAFTGFLVANVVGMVVSGRLSDTGGPRLPLAAGVVLFAAGLLVAGAAPTMAVLIVGRVVQGLASGLLITALYVVMGTAYPEQLRPKLFAAISSAWVLPSLLGPVLSGTLTEHIGWRWVFLGLLPFVAIGAALLLPVLRGMSAPGRRGDAPADRGRIGYALAVAVGIAALEQAGQHPSLLWYCLAVPGLGLVVWGLRTLLPPGTFAARPGVPAPIALRGLLAGAFFGVETIIPLALTVQHGYRPTEAGLPLACSGVSWALGAWWQGRHTDDDGPLRRVRLVRVGFVCVAVAALLVAIAVHPAAPAVLLYPAWGLAGLGAGLTMSSVGVLLLLYTNDEDRGSDSAGLQLSDATASALTTGYGGVLVAAAAAGSIGYTGAFIALTVTMAAVSALGAAVAGRARAALPVGRSGAAAVLRT